MARPFIHAGEWLACENGHRYARALVDVDPRSKVRSIQFELVDGSSPQHGSLIGVCKKCGGHRTYEYRGGVIPFVLGRGWLRDPASVDLR